MIIFICAVLVNGLELVNFENLQHYGYVQFGTQSLPVMFDTGSAVTWVATVNCYSKGCSKHIKYNPYISETLVFLDMSFEIEYGSGRIQGDLALETLEFDNYILKNVEIGLVNVEIGPVFDKLPFVGIIGISPTLTNSHFLNVLFKTYQLHILSVSLAQSQQESGFLYFSDYSPALMFPSLSEQFWQISLTSLRIGRAELCDLFEKCSAVLDTGTSVLSFPTVAYYKILNEIELNPNCSNAFDLPNLNIELIYKDFEIPAFEFIAFEDSICSFAMMSLDIPEPTGPLFILGGTFLREVTLYLDFHNKTIGIIEKPWVFVKNKLIKI